MAERIATDEEITAAVNAICEPLGCYVTEVGPDAVGSQGDNRVVGPSVFIRVPPDMSEEEIGKLATRIINETHFKLARVLREIDPL